jgi:hypothetical protein
LKKRRFLSVFVMIACLSSVIGGHFYYNNKLEQTAYAAKKELGITETKDVTKEDSTKEPKKATTEHFANAPKDVANLYKQKKEAGEPLLIHLIGSASTSPAEGTWAKLFTDEMTKVYGEDVGIQTTSIGEMTSLDLQDDVLYEELTKKQADIVLIEPPLLSDNDGVSMDDSLFVLNKLIADIKETNPEVITMLQPSNPISKPVKYAEQVEALEAFATEKAIPYLNNWTAWPSVDSEDIKKYYDSETLLPNEEGHKLWADYMIALFK